MVRRRTPYAVHRISDADEVVALIRYDGDPDVFTALAWRFLIREAYHAGTRIEPPMYRGYRCEQNAWNDDYAWIYMPRQLGERGVFGGSEVRLA
jgi:hypothetical protein